MSARPIRVLKAMLLASALCAVLAAAPAGAATPQVSIGTYNACALEGPGTVKCFGFNLNGMSSGAIGNSFVTPTTVSLGGKAISVSAGDTHSCAVLESGTVKCWGSGENGQLGNAQSSNSATPVVADLGEPGKAVVASSLATCALAVSGTVYCWGSGGYGITGTGLAGDVPVPAAVNLGGKKAVSITGGVSKMCVMVENGELWCWGYNYFGEISASSGAIAAVPTKVDLGGPIESVATYNEHICAVFAAGVVKCWGFNSYNQLGAFGGISTTVPQTINLGEPAKKIAVGWHHSCASLQSGTVKCWGANLWGQSSSDEGFQQFDVPTQYDAGGAIRDFFAGGGASCAALTTGALKCSGYYVTRYMDPDSGEIKQHVPLLILGVDLTAPATEPQKTTGSITKPTWNLKRKGSTITASATLEVTGAGMSAAHCVGNLQVSVTRRSGSGGGSGGSGGGGGGTGGAPAKPAPSFPLSYANGKCTATVKRTLPLRVAKRGVRLRILLKDAPYLAAESWVSTTKLP